MQRAAKKTDIEINSRVEKLLEDIDTGKVKVKTYTFDEHKKYIKKLLKED